MECVAHTVCSTVGLDTSGWSVPYMATWGEGGEIARYAELIDRLATRLEDAVLALGAPAGDGEAVRSLSRSCGGRSPRRIEFVSACDGWCFASARPANYDVGA